jgi:hypothetical protein
MILGRQERLAGGGVTEAQLPTDIDSRRGRFVARNPRKSRFVGGFPNYSPATAKYSPGNYPNLPVT